MKFDEYTYYVADHFVPAIFFEDYSRLDDRQYTMLIHFLDSDIFQNGHWPFSYNFESEFTRCDISGFHSNCTLLTFYKLID